MQILKCASLTLILIIIFLGINPSKRSVTGIVISGVQIGLNEANLIMTFT